ncbi:MAG: hypothetical protein WKG06_38545 [Segetibacter sp.]
MKNQRLIKRYTALHPKLNRWSTALQKFSKGKAKKDIKTNDNRDVELIEKPKMN